MSEQTAALPQSGSAARIGAVVRAELAKLVRRPAAWTLLGAAFVLSQVFDYLIPYLSYRSNGSGPLGSASKEAVLASILPGQLVGNTLGGFPVFEGALALVFGALLFGSEYGWGTVKTQLTQRPGRVEVVWGQWLTLVCSSAVAVAAMFLTGAASAASIAAGEGASTAFPSAGHLLAGYATGTLITVMWAGIGAALGTLLRGVALPVGLGVVWALGIENLISAVAASVLTALRPLRDVLPGVNAGSLVSAVMQALPIGVSAPPGVDTAVGGTRALLTVTGYVVVAVLLTSWTLRRRDVA